jgi:hypothetical protein
LIVSGAPIRNLTCHKVRRFGAMRHLNLKRLRLP